MVQTRALAPLVCLVVVIGGLPAGVGADASAGATADQQSGSSKVADALGCYPAVALSDVSMNVSRQAATNLETRGTRTASANNGDGDTFGLSADTVDAARICLRNVSGADGGTIQVELQDVALRGVTIRGPANIAFDRGAADTMTLWMPASAAVDLATQIPGALGRNAAGNDSNGTLDDPTDAVDNTTDAVNDSLDNATDPVEDTVDNTTDAVNDTLDTPIDPVDDAVENTTDAVDDTVDNTTDTVENTTDETTDAVDETVDNTTDTVENTTDETTDAVDDTVD
ncbi:hypothetical protein ACKVMT_16040, partial [Halobacteriales archaeon Cl-PHB]